MSFIGRLVGGEWRLPRRWLEIRSFAVVLPLETPDVHRAETGLRKAIKIREALKKLCNDRYKRDDLFESIDRKRRTGRSLTEEEGRYVTQADSNYLDMMCDKMQIVLLCEDFLAWSPEERSALHRLVERVPGCALVSGLQAIGDRVLHRVDPAGQLTDDEAREVLLRFLR